MSLPRSLLRVVLFSALCCAMLQAMNAAKYQHFRAAVYVRAYEVQKMKDPEWLRSQWQIIESQVPVDKVYLETHRDLLIVDNATLQAAKAFFAARGIQTAAGVATVRNEANHFEVFCYTQKPQREKIREIFEVSARNFDEIMIDDFFFTACTCDSCVQAKGARSWSEFRLELMTEVSKTLVLDNARKVNPKVKVTIKYPNWYEHFQGCGYNLEQQPPLFDQIYTGTETRDPHITGQHLQQYESYGIFRYFENIKPGANGGGWVDTGARVTADRYAEQLWLTLFAKAPEITLFAMHELLEPYHPGDRAPWQGQGASFDFDQAVASVPKGIPPTLASTAGQALRLADSVVGALGKPVGVSAYKPFHSSGEDFLHNFLGNAGIPVELYPHYPDKSMLVLLTASAAADKTLPGKIQRSLRDGATVVLSSGLLRALGPQGLREIGELSCAAERIHAGGFSFPGSRETIDRAIALPQLRYMTNASWDLVSAEADGMGYPLVLRHDYGRGRLLVLAIPDNPADLYRLPPKALSRIRELVTPGLPVRLEGPSLVSLFLYDNGALIAESFRDQETQVTLVCPAGTKTLVEIPSGLVLKPEVSNEKAAHFQVSLAPHAFRAFRRE